MQLRKVLKGDEAMKHCFIVYQYGKVGSTAVTAALNKLDGCEAHQTHFMGEESFSGILRMLLDPTRSDYFFDHSAGQLLANLRLYRRFMQRELHPGTMTVVNIAREPFDWFRSALVQDAAGHLDSLKKLLANREITADSDEEVVTEGLKLVFNFLRQCISHYGTLDAMCIGQRYKDLRDNTDHTGEEDFRVFMFFLNIFMRPHLWYHTQFPDLLGFGLDDMESFATDGLKRSEDWGSAYVLHYETVQDSMSAVMTDLGFEKALHLSRKNETQDKLFSRVIAEVFVSEEALQLKQLCHSRDTRLLGYSPPVA